MVHQYALAIGILYLKCAGMLLPHDCACALEYAMVRGSGALAGYPRQTLYYLVNSSSGYVLVEDPVLQGQAAFHESAFFHAPQHCCTQEHL